MVTNNYQIGGQQVKEDPSVGTNENERARDTKGLTPTFVEGKRENSTPGKKRKLQDDISYTEFTKYSIKYLERRYPEQANVPPSDFIPLADRLWDHYQRMIGKRT